MRGEPPYLLPYGHAAESAVEASELQTLLLGSWFQTPLLSAYDVIVARSRRRVFHAIRLGIQNPTACLMY